MADVKISGLTAKGATLAATDELEINEAGNSKKVTGAQIAALTPAASATLAGIVELATDAEINTGTDTVRAVTPANVEAWTGSAQITTLGTVATGVWQGTEVAGTYLAAATTTTIGAVELSTSAENIVGTATTTPTVAGVVEIATQLDGTPATDHTANGPQTNTFNAGYTAVAMDLVYMGAASKWLETDADATSTSISMLAIALEAGTNANPLKVATAGSYVRDDTWAWTPGAQLFVSTTLGAITATAPSASGDVVRVVGFAVTADVIYFNPSSDYMTVA